MDLTITWDDTEFRTFVDATERAIASEGLTLLLNIAYNHILPRTMDRAASVWNIRTGAYVASWYATPIGPLHVQISSYSPYAAPLETGWTIRGTGRFRRSPGVFYQVMNEIASDGTFQAEIVDWLTGIASRR